MPCFLVPGHLARTASVGKDCAAFCNDLELEIFHAILFLKEVILPSITAEVLPAEVFNPTFLTEPLTEPLPETP